MSIVVKEYVADATGTTEEHRSPAAKVNRADMRDIAFLREHPSCQTGL